MFYDEWVSLMWEDAWRKGNGKIAGGLWAYFGVSYLMYVPEGGLVCV